MVVSAAAASNNCRLVHVRRPETGHDTLLVNLNNDDDDMPVGIEVWLSQVPPITRGWLACAVLISLAVVRGIKNRTT